MTWVNRWYLGFRISWNNRVSQNFIDDEKIINGIELEKV
jgi:hypothetical protein